MRYDEFISRVQERAGFECIHFCIPFLYLDT